jgi:sigma-B regulation protein RsbU (phosphoserine phosphatase)
VSVPAEGSPRPESGEGDESGRHRAERALRASEEKLRHLFEACPLGLVLTDAAGRFLEANPSFLRMTGTTADELAARTLQDMTPAEQRAAKAERLRRLFEAGRLDPYPTELAVAGGRRLSVVLTAAAIPAGPDGPRAWWTVEDVTHRNRTEAALRELARLAAEDPNPVFRTSREGCVVQGNPISLSVLRTLGADVGAPAPGPLRELAREAIQVGASRELDLACGERQFAWIASPDEDRSHATVRGRDVTEAKRAEHQLAEAREQEIAIGAKIQELFLHGQPPRDLPGVHVEAVNLPSQRLDGDFCDFFPHGKRYLDVLIGDVMGKGLPAALLGAAVKSRFVRALGRLISASEGRLPSPVEVVSAVHHQVSALLVGLESFATVCHARFDLARHRVEFVDCGHPKTIHWRKRTGTCGLLHGNDLPLGFRPRHAYHQRSVPFDSGDVFVFYSDGLTEARNGEGELFGEERLLEIVRSHGSLPPQDLFRRVRAAVTAFTGTEQLADDVTFISVAVEGLPADRPLAHRELTMGSDLADLARGREFVRRFCREEAPPSFEVHLAEELELAVHEAISNIVQHAYGGRPDRPIWMAAEAYPDRVEVRLSHEGERFEPAEMELPDMDSYPERGFGLYLMAQCVDDLDFSPDKHDRSSMLLIKHVTASDREAQLDARSR